MSTATVERRAAVEARFDGRTLTGPAVRYGDIATGPKGPERFEPLAFVSGIDTAPLVLQHDVQRVIAGPTDGLTLTDGPLRLDLRADLRPDSAEAQLVRRGALGGLSVGFVALEEHQDAGTRILTRAHLAHIGLVDRPAYPGSTVELRQLDAATFVAVVPIDRPLQCECIGEACGAIQFGPNAFDDYTSGARDTIAVAGGGFGNVVASTARNTMSVARATAAALRLVGAVEARITAGVEVVIERAVTRAAQALVLDALAVPLLLRPILRMEASRFRDIGGVRHVDRADVRAWLIKATPNDLGHVPIVAAGTATGPIPDPMPVPERRRRIWL